MTTYIAAVNETALAVFAVVVGVTMVVTYFASKRVSTATDFWAAGRGLTGPQNGFAIAGDYMSAASFLGIAGLIFLFGFDGFLYSVGFLVAFLTVLFLLSERMRNSGKFMMIYIVAGGMLATTWVQIIKAILLMSATIVLSLFVLGEVGWNPLDLFAEAKAKSP